MTKQGQFKERGEPGIARMEVWFDRIDGPLDRIDSRLDRMEGDQSYFNNRSSEIQAARKPATIALAMGFTLVRVLNNADLARMCRYPDARDLPRQELISFSRADLVVEVSDDDGNLLFIAVECSYIADRRDTDRATRNADYLTRFTGEPAHAAVASARNHQDIQSLIDDGTVWWYQLED